MLSATIKMLTQIEEINATATVVKTKYTLPFATANIFDKNTISIIEKLTAQKKLLMELLEMAEGNEEETCVPIDALGLSPREYNLLKRANIFFISSLEAFLQFNSPTTINGCGTISAEKIIKALEKYKERRKRATQVKSLQKTGLVSVQGNLYCYDKFDEDIQMHKLSEVEIDEDGLLTATYVPAYFNDEDMKDKDITLTKRQWVGLVEYFIREAVDCTPEVVSEAAEDIVCRCFQTYMPTVDELPAYVAEYFCR